MSDRNEHCIKYFDRYGNFLFKFGKNRTREGEFNEPRCLSVVKVGQLLVSDGKSHKKVFEMSVKFLTKFGQKGTESSICQFSLISQF